MKNSSYIIALACLLFGCNESKDNEPHATESPKELLAASISETQDSASSGIVSQSDIAPENQNKSLIQIHLEELKEKYADMPNPFIAKFEGFSLGDYPHILFSDEKNIYDFGDGDNNYEGVDEEEFLKEGSELIGKTFKVYWAWQVSSFSCCEGAMDTHKERVPSIVKLEVLDK